MAEIGGEIAGGAAHALWAIISHIPLMVWLILGVGLVVFGILMRYLTDVKVDLVMAVVFVIVCLIVYYREHWIEMGYAEAQAKVKAAQAEEAGFKNTEKMIQACYAQNTNTTYLWDRTKGKCLRSDGAL